MVLKLDNDELFDICNVIDSIAKQMSNGFKVERIDIDHWSVGEDMIDQIIQHWEAFKDKAYAQKLEAYLVARKIGV